MSGLSHSAVMRSSISGTRDLDEMTVIDLDEGGAICSITIKHASERTDLSDVSFDDGLIRTRYR
jgi:uncharacterized protein YuzE